MPKLMTSPVATTTQTLEVKISPAIKRRLLTNLKIYHELKIEADALKAAMDKHKAEVTKLRELTGEKALGLEGFKTKWVVGTHKKLDKKKLVELGCALAWIDEATDEKPKKPYELITCPGEKARVEDED